MPALAQFTRRALFLWVLGAAGAALLALPGAASAQTAFPSNALRLALPFPAGGATDPRARAFAQRLQQGLGQTVVVENRAGAGGSLGSAEVARAPERPTVAESGLPGHDPRAQDHAGAVSGGPGSAAVRQ